MTLELRSYLQTIRKSRLLIVLLALLGLAGGLAAFFLTPPTYSSTVTFYVSTPLADGSNPLSAGQFAQARVNSYVSLLQSEELAKRVISDQKLQLASSDLLKEIEASAQLNTVLVTADVRDRSAAQSLQIARGIANTFGGMVGTLDNQGRKAPIVVINVVSGPTLAPSPVSPSLRLYTGLGLLSGLFLGVLVAVLRELLDTTVRSEETATSLVKAPVLGRIAYDAGTKKEPLLIGEGTNSVRGEAFRQLRTNLQFIDATETADVVMVTSSVPHEGKSTTAVNLALSFVEFGYRVLLIEADLRRPKVTDYLGIGGEIGLTEVLVGQVQAVDVIQAWGTGGLAVLPSGAIPPNPSELLGSPAMADLLKDLRSQYDKIIVDTPPLLPVTDAAVCSGVVDGVLMVLRWGRTHRTQVVAAAGALDVVNGRILGTVLTMQRATRAEKRDYAIDSYYPKNKPAAAVVKLS
jgi:capsular exopolysaccharide synthesis family protein